MYSEENPLVSIAISTFEANGRGKELLEHNIQHILKQDYKNIEIVISDHSSDDKIKNICETYNNVKYPIIYIHNPEHKGNSSQNTNNAIDHCNGEYIKILFMDDYLNNPEGISLIIDKLKQQPEKKWLVHSYEHTKNYKDFYVHHKPQFSTDIIFHNSIGCPSCVTIHKSITERFDVDLRWFMDSDFYFRLKNNYGNPIFLYHSPAIMVNLHHNDQVSTKCDQSYGMKQKEMNFIRQKYDKKIEYK